MMKEIRNEYKFDRYETIRKEPQSVVEIFCKGQKISKFEFLGLRHQFMCKLQ